MGIQLDDLNFEKQPFDKSKAYGQSKTANSLFAVQLDKMGKAHGVRAFAVHPGPILTEITRYMSSEELQAWIQRVNQDRAPQNGIFKTPQQGAATSIWCALSDQLNDTGGVYCEDCNIAELVSDDSPAGHGVRSYAIDPDKAAALWQFSETATGTRWPT
jgi:NAD(P)-dependent dehydrogenase (short-subunit alcohol dehydrogenase family)